MSKNFSTWIVLPAYNEETVIKKVINELRKNKYENIIVVDDGSQDNTSLVAQKAGAVVARHFINRGAGAATKTGLEAALRCGADIVVTMDADGQNSSQDIDLLLKPIENDQFEVVIGSRLKNRQGMPVIRIFFNFIGNFITWLLFGLWVSDSQSGFKAFSKKAVQKINILTNGYEFCSEIIREIRFNNLKYCEVPIRVKYSAYSMAKGQSLAKGFNTLFKLILRSLIN